jgi:hypothetical protein
MAGGPGQGQGQRVQGRGPGQIWWELWFLLKFGFYSKSGGKTWTAPAEHRCGQVYTLPREASLAQGSFMDLEELSVFQFFILQST